MLLIVMMIVLSFVFLLSCGSMKKKVDKVVDKQERLEEKSESVKTSETMLEKVVTDYKVSDDVLNFTIDPVGDMPAKFVFIHDGKRIDGETTGKLVFSNQKSEKSGSENRENKTQKQTETATKTKVLEKTIYITKTVNKERKAYPWWQLMIGAVLVWEIVKRILKTSLRGAFPQSKILQTILKYI